ncbi:protein ALP1-like isoform X1 [Juglans regia]|uniref:Protein ALP1-like isoform X1 n=1 Tax=Juglans regia TaxID=51240 RepID=A0A6P9DXD5_JUGRE|nr:protein ALP1-like isoform X1 [Juglans regia]
MAKATLRTSQSKSRVRKQQHSRFHPTTLFITGPQTRSFKRYYLRSSMRASREKCIGAIDGTYIDACVPAEATNAYLSRHQQVSQNVLAVCDFDMKFTFIYAGWEDTAHDARLFMDALSRPGIDFPLPPEGYYYLVDFAFPCTRGFMPPYPRVRYHRSDRHSNSSFSGYQDYFNYRHSSLRNVIERTLGVLKKRFRILKSMNPYKVT